MTDQVHCTRANGVLLHSDGASWAVVGTGVSSTLQDVWLGPGTAAALLSDRRGFLVRH